MRKKGGFFMDRRTIHDAAARSRAAELYDEGLMAVGRKYTRYSYEAKLAAARTVVDGGMTRAEAMEGFGIASTTPPKNWVRAYREGSPEALRPKPKGRPRGAGSASPPGEPTREQELERRIRKLEAENAYLKNRSP